QTKRSRRTGAARGRDRPDVDLSRSDGPHGEEPTVTTAAEHLAYRAERVPRLGMPPHARDIRIVHELDGILDHVHPSTLLRVGDALWERWSQHPRFTAPDLLMGLDAGGIVPTIALAIASNAPYRLAWKLDLDLPNKRRFTESHARRTEVF